jgi:hypothetical protein
MKTRVPMSKFGILYRCSVYPNDFGVTEESHTREIKQISDDRDSLIEWLRNKGESLKKNFFINWREDGFFFIDPAFTCVDFSIVRFKEKSDVIEFLRDQLLKSSNEELEYLYS